MEISINLLIDKLIVNPTSERDSGFNSAIIGLLKETISEHPNLKHLDVYKKYLSGYHKYTTEKLSDLENHLISGNGYAAVKFIKEVSDVGLKEAKECYDVMKRFIII